MLKSKIKDFIKKTGFIFFVYLCFYVYLFCKKKKGEKYFERSKKKILLLEKIENNNYFRKFRICLATLLILVYIYIIINILSLIKEFFLIYNSFIKPKKFFY